MAENLHADHRQRLRNRVMDHGAVSLEDHVLLELLLSYAIARKDTNELAHRLIRQFGSLRSVFDAELEQLQQVDGVGERTAVLLKLVLELTRRYFEADNAPTRRLATTEEISAYVIPKFVGATREKLLLVYLDGRSQVITHEFVGEGGVGDLSVNYRRIVERCMALRAFGLIVAHNHPSGFAFPSPEDMYATVALCRGLAPLGVAVVDHLIVAGDDCTSLRDSGLLHEKQEKGKEQ
ncbi:MAG: DNA repair protein RadC [Clostridia bacterium]|nr:DNA repair protein RadC [Clostridia bacterium]